MKHKLSISIENYVFEKSKKHTISGNFSKLVEEALIHYLKIPAEKKLTPEEQLVSKYRGKYMEHELNVQEQAEKDAEKDIKMMVFSISTLEALSENWKERVKEQATKSRFAEAWYDIGDDQVNDIFNDFDNKDEAYADTYFQAIVAKWKEIKNQF